ncbi:hypothetical protein BKI52_14605 [marine bacterium AO1-C]|nr:hypothetical protein BKI52_14605 [marine bacterium AO1-C]
MKKKASLFALILFTCFLSNPSLVAQQTKLPDFVANKLDAYIQKGMKDWHIPGLAVAIVKDDKVVFMKGYGVKELGTQEKVDENTLFMIGSNTKAFTASLLTMLHVENKMKLYDKVQKWMPEFKLKDPLATRELLVEDLLCHRIGFATFQGDFTYWGSNLSRAEVIQKMGLITPRFSFRRRWGYCNAAFVLAGELVPKVINKSWEDAMKEKILNPLKMNRTLMLCTELEKASNKALPYSWIDDKLQLLPVPQIDNLGPAGSMSSSVKDMVTWLRALINGGKVDGKQVIPSRVMYTIRRPYSVLGVNMRNKVKTHFYLYGLGLGINDRDGKLFFSHTGGVDGYLSSVMFVPEERLGIVVLTNQDQQNFFENLTDEIRDSFLGLRFQDFSSKGLKRFQRNQAKIKAKRKKWNERIAQNNKTALPLKAFTGTYQNGVYGTINIKKRKGKLQIHFSNHPKMIGHLDYMGNNEFRCTFSNPTMGVEKTVFKIKEDKVIGLTLRVADFIEFTPYKFVKQ